MPRDEGKIETLVALNVGELIEQLKHSGRSAQWLVRQGDNGHASVLVYDKCGNIIKIIRNKT